MTGTILAMASFRQSMKNLGKLSLSATIAALLASSVLASSVHAKDAFMAYPAPSLVGSTWIGDDAAAIKQASEFKGHVTIVHFWTFLCINCKHNLPYVERWSKDFDPSQVTVVGVHTPETQWEHSRANVRNAAKKLGITYPILVDADSKNWDRFHQESWPTVYVVDKKGFVRGKWVGEIQWDGQDGDREIRDLVAKLVKE